MKQLLPSFMTVIVLLAVFSRSLPGAPGTTIPAEKSAAAEPATPSVPSTLKQAKKENKHAIVLAFRSRDLQTDSEQVRTLLTKLAKTEAWKKKAVFYQLDLSQVAEPDKAFVSEYRLKSAPLPLTLVFAPNGAMVNYFVGRTFDEKALADGFAGPVRAEVVKQLQEGNAVLLCAPGRDAKQNAACLKAARELIKRPGLSGAAAVVVADPKDPKAKDCFERYSLNDILEEATIYFLFPPNHYGGQLVGETDGDKLYAALIRAFNSGGFG